MLNKIIYPVIEKMDEQTDLQQKMLNEVMNLNNAINLTNDHLNHLVYVANDISSKQICGNGSCNNENNAKPVISANNTTISVIESEKSKFFWVTYTDANDNVSTSAHNAQSWFPDELKELCQMKDKYFLDIGANIGGVALYLAACGWKGFAIEASSKNVEVLRKSKELNNFEIHIEDVGVWNKSGEIYFVQNGPWGYVCLKPTEGAEKIVVKSIDDMYEKISSVIPRVDFIKMDIEGSEVAALEGMGMFLEKMRYPTIFAEANPWTLSLVCEYTNVDMIKAAEKYGYRVYAKHDGMWKIITENHFIDSICTDYLFVHPDNREPMIEVSNEVYPEKNKNEVIDFIKDYLLSYLKAINDRDLIIEWTTAICNTLRDFPQYQTKDIKKLLSQVLNKAEQEMPIIKKSLNWFVEKENFT